MSDPVETPRNTRLKELTCGDMYAAHYALGWAFSLLDPDQQDAVLAAVAEEKSRMEIPR